jgi:uncharacterized membrane protein YphA (DoxX/SURF4 family)
MSTMTADRRAEGIVVNIVLWILQIILALTNLSAGVQHILLPPNLPAAFAWMYDIPTVPNIVIGVLEVAAALGLILPGLTRIQTRLTPLAALGISLTMVGAIVFHITRGEYQNVLFNIFFLALATVVAYGRWRVNPLKARSTMA